MTCFWLSLDSDLSWNWIPSEIDPDFPLEITILGILLIGSFRIVILDTVRSFFPSPLIPFLFVKLFPLKLQKLATKIYFSFRQKVSTLRHRFLTIIKINSTVI